MRTTLRSPAASARKVCPDQPPSSGVSEEKSTLTSRSLILPAVAGLGPSAHGHAVRPSGARRAPAGRRAGVAGGQRTGLGPVRRRVPGHARQLPRRRRLPVGAGGADRGRGRDPRRRPRQGRARGGLGRGPVLALGARPRRPRRRHRPVVPPAPALAADRRRDRGRGAGGARAPRRRCRSPTTASTWCSARSGRCSSWRTSATPSPRPPGCCAAAAASRSRSPTRRGGCSPTTPAPAGLTAAQSYWDRTPYVEVEDGTGTVAYVEHHRTLGDWVALLAGHGFRITDLLEPEWPAGPRPGLGRVVGDSRPADPRHRAVRRGLGAGR